MKRDLNVTISAAAVMLKMMEAVIMMLMTMTMSHLMLVMLMMIMTTMMMKRRRTKTREVNRIPFILVRELKKIVKSKRCKICHKAFNEKRLLYTL